MFISRFSIPFYHFLDHFYIYVYLCVCVYMYVYMYVCMLCMCVCMHVYGRRCTREFRHRNSQKRTTDPCSWGYRQLRATRCRCWEWSQQHIETLKPAEPPLYPGLMIVYVCLLCQYCTVLIGIILFCNHKVFFLKKEPSTLLVCWLLKKSQTAFWWCIRSTHQDGAYWP